MSLWAKAFVYVEESHRLVRSGGFTPPSRTLRLPLRAAAARMLRASRALNVFARRAIQCSVHLRLICLRASYDVVINIVQTLLAELFPSRGGGGGAYVQTELSEALAGEVGAGSLAGSGAGLEPWRSFAAAGRA